jgi:hypothetical protein
MANELPDRETLAAIFASRVGLAKKTEDEAAQDARVEHRKTMKWIANEATGEGSFRWFCDEYDIDVAAARLAIKEKR